VEPGQASLGKAFAPATDAGVMLVQVSGNGIIRPPCRGQQDGPGAHGKPVFGLAGSTETVQHLLFLGREDDRHDG